MPYISQEQRLRYDPVYGDQRFDTAETPGQLNYQVTMLIKDYYAKRGGGYTAINDIIGALEGAKMEFYRRVAAPYEDKKIETNGDIY